MSKGSRKRPKAGIMVKVLGNYVFPAEGILETVRKAEDATAAKKQRVELPVIGMLKKLSTIESQLLPCMEEK